MEENVKGEECRAISEEFQDSQDIRGGSTMMKAPNPIQGTHKGFYKKKLDAWVHRMCVHWRIKKNECIDTMCYNNVLDEGRVNTRADHKVQKKKYAYIASSVALSSYSFEKVRIFNPKDNSNSKSKRFTTIFYILQEMDYFIPKQMS